MFIASVLKVMLNIIIKKAGVEQLNLLLEWRMMVLREVFSLPESCDTGRLRESCRAYYEKELAAGGHVACFAWVDGLIAGCGGMCLYDEIPSPENPSGKCAYLMNIYTLPELRRHEIGRCIVDWLVARARERGIVKIYLESTRAGRRLYHDVGFRNMSDMLKLPGLLA